MPCFERLFFCPEAASFVLRVCIYHINPPGHEVRRWFSLSEFLLLFSFSPEVYCVKLIAIVHIVPLQNFAIVLAVGSCFDCPDDPVLPVNDLSDSLGFSTFWQND